MMPYVLVGILGAAIASKNKPKTKSKAFALLGPRSGLHYQAEEYPDAGFVVLHAPDRSVGSFQRRTSGGWLFLRGKGNVSTIQAMKEDMGGERL